jgi:hypothetical protein
MAQHDDTDAEPASNRLVAAVPDESIDSHERARAQAARVRESLVRCPGGGGSNAA